MYQVALVNEQSPEGEYQKYVQHGEDRKPEHHSSESGGGKHRLPAGNDLFESSPVRRPTGKAAVASHFKQSGEYAGPCPHHNHADDLNDGPAPIHHAWIFGWSAAPRQFDHAHDYFAESCRE